MTYFFIFIFGLAIGSFLNCVIYRLEINGNFLKGRSFCPNCKHGLSWQDLIPVLSFILLKRCCRYCSQKISFQYPLVELAMGFLFVLAFWRFGLGPDLFFLLLILSFLAVIFIYDLKHYIIPDSMVFSAIIVAFLYQLSRVLDFRLISEFSFQALDFKIILSPLLSAFAAAFFFFSIFFISRGKWMGFGDVKLAFLMGLMLGWPNILLALFLSFLIGAIIGLGLVSRGRKTMKSEVPFGPFLVSGTLIALFCGDFIIKLYLQQQLL